MYIFIELCIAASDANKGILCIKLSSLLVLCQLLFLLFLLSF
jgi:hypothetical protein